MVYTTMYVIRIVLVFKQTDKTGKRRREKKTKKQQTITICINCLYTLHVGLDETIFQPNLDYVCMGIHESTF